MVATAAGHGVARACHDEEAASKPSVSVMKRMDRSIKTSLSQEIQTNLGPRPRQRKRDGLGTCAFVAQVNERSKQICKQFLRRQGGTPLSTSQRIQRAGKGRADLSIAAIDEARESPQVAGNPDGVVFFEKINKKSGLVSP